MDQLSKMSFSQLALLYAVWCTAFLVLKHIASPWLMNRMFLLGFPISDPKQMNRRTAIEDQTRQMHKQVGVVMPDQFFNVSVSLMVTLSYFIEWFYNLISWPFSMLMMFGSFVMVVGRKVPTEEVPKK